MGIDLGGTKIEAIAMDDAGQERGRLRVPTPQDDYPGTMDGHCRPAGPAGGHGRARANGGARHPGHGLARHRAGEERQQHLADRPPAGPRPDATGWAGRCGWPTTPTASPCPRRPTGRAPQPLEGPAGPGYPRVVFGVIVGTGTGGGVVVDRKILVGPNSHRRRVGPQPAALDDARRSSPVLRATAASAGASRRSCRGRRWPAITSG